MTKKYINRILTLNKLGISTDLDISRYYTYFCRKCESISLHRVDMVGLATTPTQNNMLASYDIEINTEIVGHINYLNEIIIYNESLFYFSFRSTFELSPSDTYILLKTFIEKKLNI